MLRRYSLFHVYYPIYVVIVFSFTTNERLLAFIRKVKKVGVLTSLETPTCSHVCLPVSGSPIAMRFYFQSVFVFLTFAELKKEI